MSALLILTGLAAALSCFATRALLALLRRAAVLDHPNDRSSHVIPTPRGGGIAVIASIAVAALGWSMVSGQTDGGLGIALGLA
ncbi:MAG: glycosyl transferase, partial [Roseitalea sp.]|nr:glycosyl transferase [Roseitalea sp.]